TAADAIVQGTDATVVAVGRGAPLFTGHAPASLLVLSRDGKKLEMKSDGTTSDRLTLLRLKRNRTGDWKLTVRGDGVAAAAASPAAQLLLRFGGACLAPPPPAGPIPSWGRVMRCPAFWAPLRQRGPAPRGAGDRRPPRNGPRRSPCPPCAPTM